MQNLIKKKKSGPLTHVEFIQRIQRLFKIDDNRLKLVRDLQKRVFNNEKRFLAAVESR